MLEYHRIYDLFICIYKFITKITKTIWISSLLLQKSYLQNIHYTELLLWKKLHSKKSTLAIYYYNGNSGFFLFSGRVLNNGNSGLVTENQIFFIFQGVLNNGNLGLVTENHIFFIVCIKILSWLLKRNMIFIWGIVSVWDINELININY